MNTTKFQTKSDIRQGWSVFLPQAHTKSKNSCGHRFNLWRPAQRCDTLKIQGEKLFKGLKRHFFLARTSPKIIYVSENAWKFQIKKRAPLPDIFFCVKNMPKMKYHTDVIHSITQTWFSPNCYGGKYEGYELCRFVVIAFCNNSPAHNFLYSWRQGLN